MSRVGEVIKANEGEVGVSLTADADVLLRISVEGSKPIHLHLHPREAVRLANAIMELK